MLSRAGRKSEMKLFTLAIFAILIIADLSGAQTRRTRGRNRNAVRPNPRVLDRETAAKLLRPICESQQEYSLLLTINNKPMNVSIDKLRDLFPAYQISERAGWVTLEPVEGGTLPKLTDVGRKLFEENPTKEARRVGDEVYEFLVSRPAFGRVTGIHFINATEA